MLGLKPSKFVSSLKKIRASSKGVLTERSINSIRGKQGPLCVAECPPCRAANPLRVCPSESPDLLWGRPAQTVFLQLIEVAAHFTLWTDLKLLA